MTVKSMIPTYPVGRSITEGPDTVVDLGCGIGDFVH